MNKGELRQHFLDLLNNTECTDQLADTFLRQSIKRIQRKLKIPAMEKIAQVTVDETFHGVPLPDDLLSLVSVHNGDHQLASYPFSRLLQLPEDGDAPKAFCRYGNRLMVRPEPPVGSTIWLVYHAEFSVMDTDDSSNALTEIASDLIVYGALSYAADYFIDERQQPFEMRFQNILEDLNLQAIDLEMSGAGLAILPMYPS